MKRDGTRYLCFVELQTGEQEWIVLYWGRTSLLSKYTDKKFWVTPTGKAPPRLKLIIKYVDCELVSDLDLCVEANMVVKW